MEENQKKGDKPEKFKRFLMLAVFAVCALAGGFGVGYMTSRNLNIVQVITAVVMFAVFWLLAIIIHELGHLCMGLATGYEFISFRIFSFTLIKENGKLSKRKFAISGTGGQCLMTVKYTDEPENYPYFWYHFGGGFFNFITFAVSLVIFIFTQSLFLRILSAELGFISLYMGAMNVIPMKIGGISNDGFNIKQLKSSEENRINCFRMMYINGLQFHGKRLKDIQPEYFSVCGKNDVQFLHTMEILCANRYLDMLEFEKAREGYEAVLEHKNISAVYKNECLCERLFFKILFNADGEEIEELYNDENLSSYIKSTEGLYIARKRLLYAYYLLYKKDCNSAYEEYEQAVQMKNTYPCLGEVESELAVMDYLKTLI